jgi:hypothetical protein
MGRRKLMTDEDVERERKHFDELPLFTPTALERAAVEFHINLREVEEGSLLAIYSNAARAAVYRGPFRPAIRIEIDARLSARGGYDQIELWLLRPAAREVCTFINDRGEPYWRAGAIVRIEILPESITEDDELVKCFEVSME